MSKLKLHGFNNLTKSLSFNIYDIAYAKSAAHQKEYIAYIDEQYNAERLTQILTNVANIIGAHVLNIARQDYEPHGASVTMLIAEDDVEPASAHEQEAPGPIPEEDTDLADIVKSDAVVAHLDKSHITVHTYPETHPDNGISTFRVDIDVSTCGIISPLKALNYLIHSFDSDIVILDYRVRGFTRDIQGNKHYIDHDITSIQNFIEEETKEAYQMLDVNIYQENTFHTKMILNDFRVRDYIFARDRDEFERSELDEIRERVANEMLEIFYSKNMHG